MFTFPPLEIRQFQFKSVIQWQQRKCTRSVLHLQSFYFLRFLLPSPSWHLRLPSYKSNECSGRCSSPNWAISGMPLSKIIPITVPQRCSCQFWSNVRGAQLPSLDLPLQLLLLQNKNVYFKTKPVTDVFEITKVEDLLLMITLMKNIKSYLNSWNNKKLRKS